MWHEVIQWCMVPLLILNGNKIVEASLRRPIEGECRISPTPDEPALLYDIRPLLKHEIEPPLVPEQLEIHEHVQPTDGTAAPKASLPFPPSQPNHLPFQKAKKPWEWATGVAAISATQWVWAYLEEN